MTTTLRDAAQQALEALETVLSDAYHRRFPECCGRPGIECCGNPNEAWTPEDNKIMDLLSPAQRQLSDALRAALAEPAEQEPVAWLEQAAAVVEPADFPMPDVEPAEQVQSERMSLRRINQLLAPLELSHQTLADLGFYPTYPLGATLASHPNYSAGDFPKICQTISDLAAAAAWDLAAAAAWESQETAEREAYEAAQRKEAANREKWRAVSAA